MGTRPIPADGGGAALVQARVATQPELVTTTREFIPPIERSPIIYQIVLDLEIPVPDRCADVIQKIESLIQKYLTGEAYPVPVYKLPTINLAENASSKCAQTNERLVQTTELAQAAKELVTTLPGVHQQIHLLYFNNLDAPLPTQLTTSLQTLFMALGRIAAKLRSGPVLVVVRPARGRFADGRGELVGVLDLGDRRRILRDEAGRLPERQPAQDHARNTIATSRCPSSRPKRPPPTKAS